MCNVYEIIVCITRNDHFLFFIPRDFSYLNIIYREIELKEKLKYIQIGLDKFNS